MSRKTYFEPFLKKKILRAKNKCYKVLIRNTNLLIIRLKMVRCVNSIY